MKLYMFLAVPQPIVRSLFTVHSALVYVVQVCRQFSNRTTLVLLETCRVSCRSKFGKLVHLVGFITKKNCYDARHMNVKKLRDFLSEPQKSE